eukprot:s4709_g6.t1
MVRQGKHRLIVLRLGARVTDDGDGFVLHALQSLAAIRVEGTEIHSDAAEELDRRMILVLRRELREQIGCHISQGAFGSLSQEMYHSPLDSATRVFLLD